VFLDADIGKHRFDNAQTPGIDLFALMGIYPGFHIIDQVRLLSIYLDGEIPMKTIPRIKDKCHRKGIVAITYSIPLPVLAHKIFKPK